MYERYNLQINPFTDHTLNYPMVNRVETEKIMRRKLTMFVLSKNPAIIPIEGEYGVGKTFFLRALENKICKGVFFDKRKEKVLASYITAIFPKAPSQYIHYVYSQCMKRVGFDRFGKMVQAMDKLKEKEDLLHDFNRDFRNALLNFENNEEIAWAYVTGETISSHTVTVDDGLTKDSDSESSGIVTIWLSGGTVNNTYNVVVHITTSDSRTDDRTFRVMVVQR